MMTDNIFEIETAAIALRTCYPEDPGILLTDFSCAFSSVDHRWIFMVLERAGVPLPLQNFSRGKYTYRRVCWRSPWSDFYDERSASRLPCERLLVHHGFFDLVYRWLMSAVLPPEPQRPWFLQRCACACTASLREALPNVARASEAIDAVTGVSLHYKKVQLDPWECDCPTFFWVGTHVPVRHMQFRDRAMHFLRRNCAWLS